MHRLAFRFRDIVELHSSLPNLKNVKCQNNRRELFFSDLISFITFPVVQKFTCTQLLFGSISFNLGEMFWEAFHKLPTISRVNFGPFLLTELV